MANMELITSVTVGSGGASSITLPASGTIPTTYTDLKVIASARSTRADNNDPLIIEFNGSTTGYSMKALRGTGSAAQSISDTSIWTGAIPASTATASTFGNVEIYIPNYQSTNPKSINADGVGENNATTAYSILSAGLWDIATDEAITTIKLYAQNGNLVEGSTFYLYGISSVTSTPKATGGIVSQDNTYWYHTFPFTSTFTPTQALTADCLLIAGGGGGSNGGGGAGGLRVLTSQSLSTTNYAVVVGAGGTASNSGSNSSFNSNSATGGGKGGGATGTAGGSGGGAGNDSPQTGGAGNAGGYTPVEGYAGGNGTSNSGGGGGGAGGVGSNSLSSAGGNGGPGTNAYSSWADATFTGIGGYYAGGGGGASANIQGIGGVGGGGLAEIESTQGGRSGATNTGSGGGGGWLISSGAGGSGLVIIRYAK